MQTDEQGEANPARQSVADVNAHICSLLVPHVFQYHSQLRGTLINRMRDVDMWHGMLTISDYGEAKLLKLEHATQFRLCDVKGPLVITPKSVPTCVLTKNPLPTNAPLNPATNAPSVYGTTQVYLNGLSVRRWTNNTPLDLGVYAELEPAAYDVDVFKRIMANWGEKDAAFMKLIPGKTQDDYQNEKQTTPYGTAFSGGGFGPISEVHLTHFAPLRANHLLNGCVPIPPEVMTACHLPFTPEPGPQNINCWYLMPVDHLLAWPLRELSYEQRVHTFGVVAIGPITTHDRRHDRKIETYFVITDASLHQIAADITKNVLNKVNCVDMGDVGVRVMPCECPGEASWTDLSVNREYTPGTTQEQLKAIMERPRTISLRAYVNYVIFPVDFHTAPNLAPRVPLENFPKYSELVHNLQGAPNMARMANPDQRAVTDAQKIMLE